MLNLKISLVDLGDRSNQRKIERRKRKKILEKYISTYFLTDSSDFCDDKEIIMVHKHLRSIKNERILHVIKNELARVSSVEINCCFFFRGSVYCVLFSFELKPHCD